MTWNELSMIRRMVPPENEFKITPVTANPLSGEYTTQLTGGQGRTGLYVYNHSDAGSGECFWGGNTLTQYNGMPIPVGAIVQIMTPPDQDPYFCSLSGEIGDLRVLELS